MLTNDDDDDDAKKFMTPEFEIKEIFEKRLHTGDDDDTSLLPT